MCGRRGMPFLPPISPGGSSGGGSPTPANNPAPAPAPSPALSHVLPSWLTSSQRSISTFNTARTVNSASLLKLQTGVAALGVKQVRPPPHRSHCGQQFGHPCESRFETSRGACPSLWLPLSLYSIGVIQPGHGRGTELQVGRCEQIELDVHRRRQRRRWWRRRCRGPHANPSFSGNAAPNRLPAAAGACPPPAGCTLTPSAAMKLRRVYARL